MLTGLASQLQSVEAANDNDVEMVLESVDDLFAHAGLSEEQEFADRQLFAKARARLWEGFDVEL